LPSALEELARATRERFKVECHFESSASVALQTKTVATHLYRIAQEAVNNAIRHAQASAGGWMLAVIGASWESTLYV